MTLLNKLKVERKKQLEELAKPEAEKVLDKVMECIREKNVFIDDIKAFIFLIGYKDFFKTANNICFYYTDDADDVDPDLSRLIGTYGEMSKDEAIDLLLELKERFELEGMEISDIAPLGCEEGETLVVNVKL